MPCPSTLRSAPLCLCETTPFHAFALLRSYVPCHRLTFLAPPRRGCTLHCCSMPLLFIAFHRYVLPLRLRAVHFLASALHRFVSPCIALALPCVAVPLRFTAVLCYAAAIPRSGLPRHGNSSHRFSIPQQFNSAQCHSKTPPCCSMPSLCCSIHSQAVAEQCHAALSMPPLSVTLPSHNHAIHAAA